MLRSPGSEPELVGYYTLSMADVEVEELPVKVRRGLPRYPVPAARVGRLGEHKVGVTEPPSSRTRSDGSTLRRAPWAAWVVDAKDKQAVAFHARYGFVVLDENGARRLRRRCSSR